MCRLLVDAGTEALRDTFKVIYPPDNLHKVLVEKKATKLKSLKTRKVITVTQWGKLLPAIPSSMSSANFDITLSMVLACSGTCICGLFSPVTSWYTLPAVTDMSREADIARFKYYRNTVYGHTECASVDDATFTEHMLKRHQVRLGETGWGEIQISH